MIKIKITGKGIPKAQFGFGVNNLGGLGLFDASNILGYATSKPTTGGLVASLVDPTGISNWPFLHQSWEDWKADKSLGNTIGLGLDVAGSLPFIGAEVNDVVKGTKLLKKAKPFKQLTLPGKVGRGVKTYIKVVEAPATAVNKIYKKIGVPLILNNGINNYNRGLRGWEAGWEGLKGINDAINNYQPSMQNMPDATRVQRPLLIQAYGGAHLDKYQDKGTVEKANGIGANCAAHPRGSENAPPSKAERKQEAAWDKQMLKDSELEARQIADQKASEWADYTNTNLDPYGTKYGRKDKTFSDSYNKFITTNPNFGQEQSTLGLSPEQRYAMLYHMAGRSGSADYAAPKRLRSYMKLPEGSRFTDQQLYEATQKMGGIDKYADWWKGGWNEIKRNGGSTNEIPNIFTHDPARNAPGRMELGGTPPNCDPGYMIDPMDNTKCIKDPNAPAKKIFPEDDPTSDQYIKPVDLSLNSVQRLKGNIQQRNNTRDQGLAPCGPGFKYDFKTKGCVPITTAGDKIQNASEKFDAYLNFSSGLSNMAQGINKQQTWDKNFRQNKFNSNVASSDVSGSHGNFHTNDGTFRDPGYNTQNFGAYGGTMLKDSNMGNIKIRIVGGPKDQQPIKIRLLGGGDSSMAYGGQSGYGFDIGARKTFAEMPQGKIEHVSNQINEVPREEANIEAEKGETVYGDMDGDGFLEHMDIGGKRHVDGGTPLKVPEGSFVFSDTKKMIIKDPQVLAKFGMAPSKAGYTPAEIAKKYDINKYKAILEDPTSDPYMINAASLMIKNYQTKLSELAVVQEEIKGFPQGIPDVAKKGMSEEKLAALEAHIAEVKGQQPQQGQMPPQQDEQPQMEQQEPMEGAPQEEMNPQEEPEMLYGGGYMEYGGDLNHFNEGGEEDFEFQNGGLIMAQNGYQWNTPDIENAITSINSQTGKKVVVSPRVSAGDITIPSMQHKQSSGLYGEITPDLIDEFRQRHKWYFKNHPNWSPHNPNDVKDFQNKYDEEFAKKYGFVYFPGDKKYNKKDTYFGEYTYNAPGLEEDETPEIPGVIPVVGYKCINGKIIDQGYPDDTALAADGASKNLALVQANCVTGGTTIIPPPLKIPPTQVPYKYLTPDRWKMAAAAGMIGNKYLPYLADVNYDPGNFIPEEWRAKASQLQALARQSGEQMGAFLPGQSMAANESNIYGQAADKLIGAVADVDTRNVAGANAFNQAEQGRKDKFDFLRAANASERWKGNVIANQQWDNFLNKKMVNTTDTAANAWLNRMYLGQVNATKKTHYTDPITGQTIFKGGYGPENLGGKGTNESWEDFQQRFPGQAVTPQDYINWMKLQKGKTDTDDIAAYGGTIKRKKSSGSSDLAEMLSRGYSHPF